MAFFFVPLALSRATAIACCRGVPDLINSAIFALTILSVFPSLSGIFYPLPFNSQSVTGQNL
jgi:hypothetical protein